jgi:CBS domain-containing protein
MNSWDIGSVIVVQGERPVGIITERDVLRRALEESIPLNARQSKEIMTTPILSINADASVQEAADLMVKRKIKKLAVTENGRLCGIITYTDIALHVPNMLRIVEELVRPHKTR